MPRPPDTHTKQSTHISLAAQVPQTRRMGPTEQASIPDSRRKLQQPPDLPDLPDPEEVSANAPDNVNVPGEAGLCADCFRAAVSSGLGQCPSTCKPSSRVKHLMSDLEPCCPNTLNTTAHSLKVSALSLKISAMRDSFHSRANHFLIPHPLSNTHRMVLPHN